MAAFHVLVTFMRSSDVVFIVTLVLFAVVIYLARVVELLCVFALAILSFCSHHVVESDVSRK